MEAIFSCTSSNADTVSALYFYGFLVGSCDLKSQPLMASTAGPTTVKSELIPLLGPAFVLTVFFSSIPCFFYIVMQLLL